MAASLPPTSSRGEPQWAELPAVKRVVSSQTESADKVFKQINSTKDLGGWDRFLHKLAKYGIFSGKRWVPVAKTNEGKLIWVKVGTLIDNTHLSKDEIKQVLKQAKHANKSERKDTVEHGMHVALAKRDAEDVCQLLEQTPLPINEIKEFLKNAVVDTDVWLQVLSQKQLKVPAEKKVFYNECILYVRLTPAPAADESKAILLQLAHQAQLRGKTLDEVQKMITGNQFLPHEQKVALAKELTKLQDEITTLKTAHAKPLGKQASAKEVASIVNLHKVALKTFDEDTLGELQGKILTKLQEFLKGGNDLQQLEKALSGACDEEGVLNFEVYLKEGITHSVTNKDKTLNLEEYTRLLFQAAHVYPDMLDHFASLANTLNPGPDKNKALTALFAARALAKENTSF